MKSHNKSYLYLWLLLVVALVLVAGYAFVDFPESESGSPALRQAPFRDVILAEGPSEAEELSVSSDNYENSDSAGFSAPAHSLAVQEPDTTVRSVLIFGDSMTILVANRMAAYGQKNGYKVVSVTWDSSSSVGWSGCDTLDNVIARYHPDFIMVTLGSNELFLKNFDLRRPYVEKLVAKIGDIPFVWVGPPNWQEDKGFNKMMAATLPRGTFFCSDGLELPRGADHIHPTPKGGVIWTDSIMRWMPSSRHPIPSEMPDSGVTTRSHKAIYYPAK